MFLKVSIMQKYWSADCMFLENWARSMCWASWYQGLSVLIPGFFCTDTYWYLLIPGSFRYWYQGLSVFRLIWPVSLFTEPWLQITSPWLQIVSDFSFVYKHVWCFHLQFSMKTSGAINHGEWNNKWENRSTSGLGTWRISLDNYLADSTLFCMGKFLFSLKHLKKRFSNWNF